MEVTVLSQVNKVMNITTRKEWKYRDNHCLVIKEPKPLYWTSNGDKVRVSRIRNNKNKYYKGCWEHISCIHIIPARKCQLYLAKCIDCPHYQLLKKEYKSWIKSAFKFAMANNNLRFLCHYDKEKNSFGLFVAVVNKLTQSFDNILDELKVQELLEFVLKCQTKDNSRGNKYVDVGFG